MLTPTAGPQERQYSAQCERIHASSAFVCIALRWSYEVLAALTSQSLAVKHDIEHVLTQDRLDVKP